MSTKVVSSADPILHLSSKPIKSSKKPLPQEISSIFFKSQVMKSRISIGNPFGPACRVRAAARMEAFYAPAETKETLYELLGITETGNTTLSDIKKAYKRMASKYHPDVSPPDRVEEYTQRFIMVQEAYETLSDPLSRSLYDRDLAAGLGFGFSTRKSQQHHQKMEEKGEWKVRWEAQLEGLKRRDAKNRERMSWGAKMRSQNG